MVEWNSHETNNMYPNSNKIPLNDQQQFRLYEINEINNYFVAEIKERELMSKRPSKYIPSDYFDKSLTVLSVLTGSIYTALFATVIEAPVGIASEGFSLVF